MRLTLWCAGHDYAARQERRSLAEEGDGLLDGEELITVDEKTVGNVRSYPLNIGQTRRIRTMCSRPASSSRSKRS